MIIVHLILAIACAVQTASASSLLSLSYSGDDLDALCNGRSVDLFKISQLNSLVEQLDQGSGCPGRIASALRALKELIEKSKNDECSMASIESFKAFYKEFLDRSDKDHAKNTEKLPGSLNTFALSYGLKLSSLCRANMVKILVTDARAALKQEDFDELMMLVGPDGTIAERIGQGGKKPDQLRLPSDFMAVMSMGAGKEKIGLKMQTTPLIKRIQIVCQRRFKPIYSQVMLPLAHLANLGFEYRGAELKKELKAAINNKETCHDVAMWSRIVLLCEGLSQIELVEEKKDATQAEGNDATMVQVLTPDEAEAAKRHYELKNLLDTARVKDDDIQELLFKPCLDIHLPDVVIKPFDLKKKLSLAWISTNQDEATKIRLRFFTANYDKLLEDMASFKLNSLFGVVFNKLKEHFRFLQRIDKNKVGQKYQVGQQDIVTDIVRTFNERVDKELNPDRNVGDDDCGCSDLDCNCDCNDVCCCSSSSSSSNNYYYYHQTNNYGTSSSSASDQQANLKLAKFLGYLALFGSVIAVLWAIIYYIFPIFIAG